MFANNFVAYIIVPPVLKKHIYKNCKHKLERLPAVPLVHFQNRKGNCDFLTLAQSDYHRIQGIQLVPAFD